MNVLSLFDGMSCGQIALKELGLKVDNYYASEIDKFAIKQTQYNFLNTIQLGNVTDIKAKDLPKIDLLIGGSPCQGFSFAGKQLNFNDPRSKLFFEFVRLKNELKPKYFLLENVNMKKEYLRLISEYLGVFPVNINSNLVSAQKRNRWYWSNIKTKDVGLFSELWTDIPQPKDRKILLKDILQPESEIDEKYYINNPNKYDFKNIIEGGILSKNGELRNIMKSNCIDANYHKGIDGHQQRTGVCVLNIPEANKNGYSTIEPGQCVDLENLNSNTRRGRKMIEKSNCLMTGKTQFYKYTENYRLRRLTPKECSRLQTIPEWYEWIVSDTQIYRMLGNGWTVEIIKHIFSYIPKN